MTSLTAQLSRHFDSSTLRRRLLVIERGSSSPAYVSTGDFDETVAIPQLQDEAAGVFMQRVLERVAAAEQSGGVFRAAVLMTGAQHDPATRAARRQLLSGLASHTRVLTELPDIVVDADASAGPEQRQQLLELVDDLVTGSDPRQAIPIRLRFNERRARRDGTRSVFGSTPALEA
ncbi:MAG TPA: hypothetical protein VNG33_09885 [Polyangiaceae bacterium]|nr:hypothetical protein [Polyangiaceae bacterium]